MFGKKLWPNNCAGSKVYILIDIYLKHSKIRYNQNKFHLLLQLLDQFVLYGLFFLCSLDQSEQSLSLSFCFIHFNFTFNKLLFQLNNISISSLDKKRCFSLIQAQKKTAVNISIQSADDISIYKINDNIHLFLYIS